RPHVAPARAADGARDTEPTACAEPPTSQAPSRCNRRGPVRTGPRRPHRRTPSTRGTARRRVSPQSGSRRIEQVEVARVERDADAVARSEVGEAANPRDHALATGVDVYQRVRAERLDDAHLGRRHSLAGGAQAYMPGAPAQMDLTFVMRRGTGNGPGAA